MSKDFKNYGGNDRIVNSHDYYEAVGKLPEEKRYMTGLHAFDKYTEGFTNGELITVSGYTGYGKTSFCQTIAYNLGKQGVKSLWFSFELSARQFFNKYKGKEVPLFYMPRENKPYDLSWIEDRIIECKQKFGLTIAFIDHLHYIVPMTANDRKMNELVGETMRYLKHEIAVKHEVAIVLMAHTKQPKDMSEPTLADLRDSSFVAQESDAVYLMHRPTKRGSKEFEDYGTVTVVKQRNTGVIGGTLKLTMHNKMFFDYMSHEDERAL